MRKKYLEPLKNMIFPEHCVLCSSVGLCLCERCKKVTFKKWQSAKQHYRAQEDTINSEHTSLFSGIFYISDYNDSLLRLLLHKYKYEGMTMLSETLGSLLAKEVKERYLDINYITYIPTSKKRLFKRGFDHTKNIALVISRTIKVPVLTGLIKIEETRQQVGLNRKERLINMSGSFGYSGPDIEGKNILIIDDVMTTGTTLGECAKILTNKKVKKLYGAVLLKE